MEISKSKQLLKCLFAGIVWFLIAIGIGYLIIRFTGYSFKDVLFMEGILLIIIGALSSIGGNPMGLSLQSMGQVNSQYVSNANLEVTKKEKNSYSVKTTLSFGISMIALIIGGAFSILLSFVI
ncbi:hypothetical protein [Clostridium sp. 'White wine YQ']|uniref:hypothetical protein n=1 Tax=Clostridium sp. 'White wine YQ' TaxID=3027474 RepID=UPI002366058B|nr:hypothetical protein [Clostridium sp. 'White wine YQ']MDD7793294.1 hypothetical protein [Clostridium sp. 'White wine YQ']